MWDHIINIHLSELLSTKIKESRINETQKKKRKCFTIFFFFKKKWTIYILYLIISLQFFFKELTRHKNDYQFYLNYIYRCRDDRPRNVYWVVGPIRGHLIVRRRVNVIVERRTSEWSKGSGHEGPGRKSEDKCHLSLTK